MDNYRPIALLNAFYKIFAAILKLRISAIIDPDLIRTQYGFRTDKSTADALHCIRRIMDIGESTGRTVLLLLLDWEKAFDKVSHEGLFLAMQRMRVDPKLISLTRMLYRTPTFYTEIQGESSPPHTQLTGIRQGCPLSPYLFLVILHVLFHDVHAQTAAIMEPHRLPTAPFD